MYYIVTDNTGRVTYMYDCSNLNKEIVLEEDDGYILTEESIPEGEGELFFINGKFERRVVEPIYTPEQYDYLVSRFVREKYSIDAELAVIRQKETKPDEFEEYFSYVETCKERARNLINAV